EKRQVPGVELSCVFHHQLRAAPRASLPTHLFRRVGMSLACRDQAAQTVVDIEAPRARTLTVALERGNQADVRDTEFGLAILPVNLEDDVRAVPLGSVFDEVDVAVDDVPDDSLAWHPFGNPLSGVVDVLVAVPQLGAERVGASVNLS